MSAELSPSDRPKFHYGRSYLRWLLWVGSLVIGFGIGDLIWAIIHPEFLNLAETGLAVAGLMVAAPIAALLLALLGLFRTKPVDLVFGILVALLVGALIGVAPPGRALEAILRIAVWGGFVFLGHLIGKSKNRARTGSLLGLFLGPVGLIIALCLPKATATHE